METDTPQSEKQSERRALIPAGPRGIELHSLNDFYRFAEYVVAAGAVPAGLSQTVAGVIIALQRGAEVGLLPMQSLQSIYIVNNVPQLFGDAPKGIVLATGLMEKCDEFTEGVYPDDNFKAVCIVKRRGFSEKRSEFSIADAKTAKLWDKQSRDGKPSPWILYPKRMLRWRALGYALRDEFSDVLKGFPIRELMDDADNAFEHAKVAQARVVAPNFADEQTPAASMTDREESPKVSVGDGKPALPMAAPSEPAKRGRPPKKDKADLFDPPKPKEVAPEPAAAPEQEPTPAPEQGPGPHSTLSPKANELLAKLVAAKLELGDFLELMARNGYLEGADKDLANVLDEGLEAALQQWPKVVEHLQSIKNERERPFA